MLFLSNPNETFVIFLMELRQLVVQNGQNVKVENYFNMFTFYHTVLHFKPVSPPKRKDEILFKFLPTTVRFLNIYEIFPLFLILIGS